MSEVVLPTMSEILDRVYEQGGVDERIRIMSRVSEVDADFISIDHLIEILGERKFGNPGNTIQFGQFKPNDKDEKEDD